jgi:MFS family permease
MHEIPAFLLDALRFQNGRQKMLRQVRDAEWQRVLSDWHVARLTLPLRQVCGDELPAWVREQIDVSIAKTNLRFERVKSTYLRLAENLQQEGIPQLVIKGFSLWPGFTEHPKYRPQSDIDLYIPPEKVFHARDSLLTLGYRTQSAAGKQVFVEHLPALQPPHSWVWQGDNFDPTIPISLELHFSWWDKLTTRIRPKGLKDFWPRRQQREIDGIRYIGLAPADNLGYTAINLLRTTLRVFPAPEQVYGLARFLHLHRDDHALWSQWRTLHPDSLRRLEAITFRLAQDWFACRLSDEAQDEVNRLPSPIHRFLAHFSKSSRSPGFGAMKDGLWLHLELLESRKDKAAVFFQRVVPIRAHAIREVLGDEPLPQQPSCNHDVTSHAITPKWHSVKNAGHFIARSIRHSALLPITLARGLAYGLSRKNLGTQFWTFFAASFCFDLGMTMYFFLYNIYLLDRGFKEDFLGWMLSAMSIGGLVCTIPAGFLIQRLGIRKSLLFCITTLSAVLAARALFEPSSAILGLALLGGFLTTIWAVAISPAIALLTDEESRPLGFSVVFSSGIGVGIVANLAASRLPSFLMHFNSAISATRSKQIVLLISSAIVALAVVPLFRLKANTPPASEKKVYPWNPFLLRFLPALALWSLVTGSLSPLANVYFQQYLHTSLSRMGIIFSFSNLLQVLGILIAPFIFRKLGIVTGVASTQLVAALLLGFLAVISSGLPAAFVYVGFTGFLWMSEPGLFSLLMSGVPQEQRTGASALNFLVISLVQAGAVAATGASIARFGYPTVLGAISVLAAIAATAFWILLEPRSPVDGINPLTAHVPSEH